ncbi:Mur ligase family protein [Hornefia butyriciproducens]|uniref:Mur ligase family protein n=1 Tax=Hornefia butyriciproducens TaxID=2652293 RepID=UPI0023EFF56C|nr:Mur ligase family protein [Hornefia butyriciproducens]MDD6298595.1 MurT ligase domain-containing protein [Hornefia butyriciproducens]
MRFYIALWFAKIVNGLINLIDKSRGSNFAGEHAMKIDPQMVAHFKGIDPDRVLFITGTNGKSTTNNLVNHIFRENGKKVVSNLEGANLIYGVCTALIKASSLTGRVKADYFIFETDERFVPVIRRQLPAASLLITNLQKDQVQRNGDPDFIYRKLKEAVKGQNLRIFLNNEEPRARAFDEDAREVVSFGVARHSEAFRKSGSYVTMACPRCHHKIVFDYYNTDGIGAFHCSNCGHHSLAQADYTVEDVDFENRSFREAGADFTMPYDTPYMLYNYSAAVAVAKEFGGIEPSAAAKAFAGFRNVGGRFEIMHYKGKTIKYMRIKQENPETLQTSINVMAADPNRKMVALGLCPLVDMIPHYAVTFYAYDCDFSKLVKSDVEKYFCFSNPVCYDTANRFIYEGVDPAKITIEDSEDIEVIFREIEESETDNIYLITWLHTYEHMEKFLKKEGAVYE